MSNKGILSEGGEMAILNDSDVYDSSRSSGLVVSSTNTWQ
jgi:hypothetical protein